MSNRPFELRASDGGREVIRQRFDTLEQARSYAENLRAIPPGTQYFHPVVIADRRKDADKEIVWTMES